MLICRMCGEKVKANLTAMREHLEGHHPNAADLSAEEVRDQFKARGD